MDHPVEANRLHIIMRISKALSMKPFALLSLAVFLLLTAGCREDKIVSESEPAEVTVKTTKGASATNDSPTHAQARLQTLKLWVGTNELTAELALTLDQIETGMMWRTNMAEMDGMLFVFPQPYQTTFWMKNTLLPLSCAYINSEGIILEIHEMKPKDESPISASSDQVQYVLEVNQGWFKRHGVTTGMLIKSERGTLRQTFFRK
jgi:uncharacterized membrane protein (UPF0127 family)